MSVFSELKRRNVFRVAAAYLVAGWLLIEVSATLEETLHLPAWADTLLAYFLILGFPIALFFSWAYEITSDGIKREKDIDPEDTSRHQTARRLDWTVIFLFGLALAVFVVDRFVLEGRESPPAVAESAPVEPIAPAAGEQLVENVLPGIVPALSIAVLPFVNMSSDEQQEYFSDGLTEELLNLLAGVGQLKVAARTSSFYYKNKLDQIPLAEIARQLEVAHVLEGSVRKAGNRIRITAQLIKADDGFHLWSNTWDRTLDDIFAIQDEIAAAVTEELKITLLGAAPKAAVVDTESYELALQGRYLFTRRSDGDLEHAFELFEQAVELDRNNAMAWIGLAPLYIWLFDPPRLEKALEASERAVTLEPENPEAWSRRALALWNSDQRVESRTAWARAQSLGGKSALIQAQVAGYKAFEGDLEGAIEAQRLALLLDPLHPTNLGNLSSYLVMAGRFDEAIVYANKVLTLSPGNIQGLETMADIHLLQGRPEQARELIDRSEASGVQMSLLPNSRDWYNALIEHSLGNSEASDAALERVIANERDPHPLRVACVYAWRGENDAAFEWLERTLAQTPELSVQASWEPWLNSLEDDPRWAELMTRWTGAESPF